MRRYASASVAVAACLFIGAVASGCYPDATRPSGAVGATVSAITPGSVPPLPSAIPSATASSALTGSPPVTTDPTALWKRTLTAQRTVPVRATVTETRFASDGRVRQVARFDVVEGGDGPRYRLTRVLPASVAGNVEISDGHSAWRYNPQKKTVVQTTASALTPPAEMDDGAATVVVQAETLLPEIEPHNEKVDGRNASVLALRRQRTRRIVERRWVDQQTGRTLRLEQYARPDAHLLRRVELTGVLQLKPSDVAADAPAFHPDFPPDSIVVDRRGRRMTWQSEAERAARHVHLPLHVRGYVVRSVDHTADLRAALPLLPSAPNGKGGTTHLLYSSGEKAISVFVTPPAVLTGGKPVDLQPGPTWKPASLDVRMKGFTQESSEGSAVAWAEPHRGCYIVVARMPLSDLLPVAGAFASDRDDAPGVSVASVPASASSSASPSAR